MRFFAYLASALLLSACASPPAPPAASDIFLDHAFDAPAAPVDTSTLFALNPAMRSYLQRELVSRGPHHLEQRLYDALYAKQALRIDYSSERTGTPAETFAAKSGNCLSLVLMTAAFAKELGMEVRYQLVKADAATTRVNDLYLENGHVNISIGRRRGNQTLTIDFVPGVDARRLPFEEIDEANITSRYLNNRAAEWMAAGQLSEAYWWARAAIQAQPREAAPYNTLAVIYQRHGQVAQAEHVLRLALERHPAQLMLKQNLLAALEAQGKRSEAAQLAAALAKSDPHPAYAWYEQGRAAMRAGDFARARGLFAKEVERAPYNHEFHFWLALAHQALGDARAVQEQLALAQDNATTHIDRARYASKLAYLRGLTPALP